MVSIALVTKEYVMWHMQKIGTPSMSCHYQKLLHLCMLLYTYSVCICKQVNELGWVHMYIKCGMGVQMFTRLQPCHYTFSTILLKTDTFAGCSIIKILW